MHLVHSAVLAQSDNDIFMIEKTASHETSFFKQLKDLKPKCGMTK